MLRGRGFTVLAAVTVVVAVAAVPLLTGAGNTHQARSDQARDDHQRTVGL